MTAYISKRVNLDLWFAAHRARILRRNREAASAMCDQRAEISKPGPTKAQRAARQPRADAWKLRRYAYLRNKGYSIAEAMADIEGGK